MNITILGAGAYGLALSSMFLENKCNITIWTKLEEEKNNLQNYRCNKLLLPDYIIDKSIKITNNLEEAINNANIIVIAIPIKFINSTLKDLKNYYKKNQHICIASKGIEQETNLFINEIVKKHIKTNKICVISGGTFAIDMIKKIPLGLTIATKSKETLEIIEKSLKNQYLTLSYTKDIIGVEICGSIKNIIAISSGIIDGMNYPESTKCMFLTKSLNDILDFITKMNGNKNTILEYAGIGDLILTCNSQKSRNYTLGLMIGKKEPKTKIDKYINNTTIEGLYTLKSLYDITKKRNINIPIIDITYDIIYNHKNISLIDTYLQK